MKKAKKTRSLLLAFLFVFSLLSGCGQPSSTQPSATQSVSGAPALSEDEQTIHVGVSVASATNNPHLVAVVGSLVAALEAQGWEVELQDADGDASKQSLQFDNLVTKEKDLIIYWAHDAQAAVADAKKAADAGIPVISYFADCAEEAHQYIEAYVGADQLVIANAIGEYLDELLGGDGSVAIINGKEGKTDFVLRSQGFRDALDASGGNYTILAEEWSDSDRTQAQSIMENYLTTYPDIDAIFTTSDDFGYGALNAIESAGKAGEIKLVSIDGQIEVLQAIKDGKWDLTVYQTPAMMADKCVEVAQKVLAGEEIGDYNQNTDYYLVTAENVDDYLNQ